MRKRGRPQARYRCTDGTEIPGLSRQKDGRWRISETGETFFALDEYEALARFQSVTARIRHQDRVHLPLQSKNVQAALAGARAAGGTKLVMIAKATGAPPDYAIAVGSEPFFAAVRRMLIEQPKMLAMKTGVEWVAYGEQLPKPVPALEVGEAIDVYAGKPGITAEDAVDSGTSLCR